MTTTYFATAPQFKPPVRQEGFHLPQQGPPSPSSSSTGSYDPTSMFILPDAYRKYPSQDTSAIDLSEELASLIAGPNADLGHAQNAMHMHNQQSQQHHQQHHPHAHGQQQQPQQQPHDFRGVPGSFDDSYRPQTHNIFDISAPSVTHPSLLPHPSQSQLPTPSSSAPAYPSAFSLQTSQRQVHDNMSLISPSNSLHSAAGPLQEFNARFNSTLPALNSSMRFDPHPPAPTDPGSSGPSAFALQHDYSHATRQQHTPSPSQGQSTVSRSRSRSRAPSTGPGPTRTQSTTRAKRNSISSTSPPPRPTTSIIIPGSMPPLHRANSLTAARGGPGAPDPSVGSPLSLGSAGGWFIPPTTPQQTQHAEYSLPTPDSISSHFGLPGRDHSVGPSLDGGRDPSPPGPAGLTDVAAKQAAIANEKRRRRRESHNAVERRRRDNINEKIGELATLIPECMLDPNAPSNIMPSEDQIMNAGSSSHAKQESSDAADASPTPTGVEPTTPSAASASGDSAAAKANKGIILRKSVDYIRHLQQLVSAQASRNRVLEQELASYRARDGSVGSAGSIDANGDDLSGLVLHNEVDMSAFMSGDFSFDGSFDGTGNFGSGGHGSLASVREMMEMEDDRPDTAMTDASALLTPPSLTGSGSPSSTNGDDDDQPAESLSSAGGFHHAQAHHEEERGRRGRDGRVGGALDEVRVKREE